MMKKILALSIFALLLASCDKIEQPLKNEYGFVPLPDSSSKVILLEEFTGTSCNNCPKAAAKAKEFQQTFPGQVVLLAIHAGGFAIPNEKHPVDFRTETGNAIYDQFTPIGVPSGMFNRSGDPETVLLSGWDDAIARELSKPALLALNPTLSYDEASKEMRLRTEVIATSNLPAGNYYFSAMLYEDSIVAPQTLPDGTTIDKDYVHMHVLRDKLTASPFGEALVNGAINNGAAYAKSYSITINPDWNLEHLGVVFFVYDRNLSEDTYEVIQAGSAHL